LLRVTERKKRRDQRSPRFQIGCPEAATLAVIGTLPSYRSAAGKHFRNYEGEKHAG